MSTYLTDLTRITYQMVRSLFEKRLPQCNAQTACILCRVPVRWLASVLASPGHGRIRGVSETRGECRRTHWQHGGVVATKAGDHWLPCPWRSRNKHNYAGITDRHQSWRQGRKQPCRANLKLADAVYQFRVKKCTCWIYC